MESEKGKALGAGRPAALSAGLAAFACVSLSFSVLALEVPTDRVIVRLKGGAPAITKGGPEREALAVRLMAQSGELMRTHRVMGDGAQVMQLFRRLPPARIQQLFQNLEHHPEVLEVVPDRLFFPAVNATDPLFASQWALSITRGINAPGAWDISTGANNLIIGIIDTGRLPHQDLAGRWIGGYDFVSLAERGNDSDLRDADPSDPGDWVTIAESASGPLQNCPVTDSRWHGTAMAGAIGANANNGLGIAGINWKSKLLPVRVIGKCGGYESDIADGIRWAVGIAVPAAPSNPNTADILNVSLSAPGPCSAPLQSAINEVLAAGAPIIVAAGNNSLAASGYSPANCGGVIAVGAVDKDGAKPAYANFGPPIALAAPGGISDTPADAVLTTRNEGTTTPSAANNFYASVNGTSIAAAQVTGIASLMLSANPSLSPLSVLEILQNTSRAFPAAANACSPVLCGAGIANAKDATGAAARWGIARPAIAAAFFKAAAVNSQGELFVWGGDYDFYPEPFSLVSAVRAISISEGHYLALRADGTVWAWGRNNSGQLGNGLFSWYDTQFEATQVIGISGATAVSAGWFHSVALRSDGTVWAWGENDSAQLGNGTLDNGYTATKVDGLSNVVAISANPTGNSSLALKSDGTVWCWGSCPRTTPGFSFIPTQVPGVAGAISISVRGSHWLAALANGSVMAWGANDYGESGKAPSEFVFPPAAVVGLSQVTQVSAGGTHSLALRNNGTVLAWGNNEMGQLGNGSAILFSATPVAVSGLVNAVRVEGGYDNSYAIKADGSLVEWGGFFSTVPIETPGVGGQGSLNLGLSDPVAFISQFDVATNSIRISNAIVVTGIANGATVRITGGTYSVGCTETFTATAGTIGNGASICVRQTSSAACNVTTTTTLSIAGYPTKTFAVRTGCDVTPDRFSLLSRADALPGSLVTSNPVLISGLTSVAPISITGGMYSIGCAESFTSAPGFIANGQTVCVRLAASALNDSMSVATLSVGGATSRFIVFSRVGPDFLAEPQVSVAESAAAGLRSDGTVFIWGKQTPQPFERLSGVRKVSAGVFHYLATRGDGSLWAWGSNLNGQLGLGPGSPEWADYPVQVGGLPQILSIAAGAAHSLALDSSGLVWAWGHNNNGQLGNGTLTTNPTPAKVVGISNVVSIATNKARLDFPTSVAVKADGTVWCWGACWDGAGYWQRPLPTQVSGLNNVVDVVAGGQHFLALKADGSVWSWGGNDSGQIGNGVANGIGVFPPVQVMTGAARIAAGSDFSIVVTADSAVWGWGRSRDGQLGIGPADAGRLLPTRVTTFTGPSRIVAGAEWVLALKADGSVYAWGDPDFLSLGVGDYMSRDIPTRVVGPTGTGYLDLGLADPLSFAPRSDVTPNTPFISNAILVTGIVEGASISITGGEYSIGCTAVFTSLSGAISNGQTVCVRLTSPVACDATATVTLAIAGFPSKTFSVKTICDTTLEPFHFFPRAMVPVGAVVVSNTVTIVGLNVPVPVTISGGAAYSIGCNGTFVVESGLVANGQTLCVRQLASAANDSTTTATLTVGSFSAPFHVTTEVSSAFRVAPRVVAGGGVSVGLRSDGTLFMWGATHGPIPRAIDSISGVRDIAIGSGHYLAARSDGTAWTWDGDSPRIVGGLTGIRAVSAGWDTSFALLSDGTVWGWGQNYNGALGDGTTSHREAPVQVVGLTNVVQIVTSSLCSRALRVDGTVWEWGQCVDILLTPVQMAGLTGITKITGGYLSAAMLKSDGTVLQRSSDDAPFTVVPNLTGVVDLSSDGHTLAVHSDGSVWAWGLNVDGELGLGNSMGDPAYMSIASPTRVVGVANAVAVSAGSAHSLALLADGSVRAWGEDRNGELGDGSQGLSHTLAIQVLAPQGNGLLSLQHIDSYPDPFALSPRLAAELGVEVASAEFEVSGMNSSSGISILGGRYSINGTPFTSASTTVSNGDRVVVSVMSADAFSVTTSATLSIGGFGGKSATFYVRTRDDVTASHTVPQVSAGDSHTLMLASDGVPYGTGYNGNGQLGNGSTLGLSSLRPVAGLSAITSLSSGAFHSIALRSDGSVAAWGSNSAGQLGHGSSNALEHYFVDVQGLTSVIAVGAGNFHSVALRTDGTVWAWGLNVDGQVGNSSNSSTVRTPAHVSGITGAIAVAVGGRHTLALRTDGSVWAWGANDSGQLGDGTRVTRRFPVVVPGLSGIVAVAAGAAHSLALKADGSVVAWGFNAFGQLGEGTTNNRLTPTAVALLTDVGLIACGANHSIAVKTGGVLYSWGNNENSQLGLGTNAVKRVPTRVPSPTSVVAISGGARHSAAITSERKLYLWGDNFFGQVGNRSGNYSPHSASLNVLRGDSDISTGTSGSGGSVGTGSNSGSSVLEIDGQATGFSFGTIAAGALEAVGGKYRNQAAHDDIHSIALSVSGSAFSLASTNCPATLAPDAECSFSIRFNPATARDYSGELVILSSVVGSPEKRSLNGQGLVANVPAITFAKSGLDFPPQTVGSATAAAPFTLTNTGNAALTIQSITRSLNDFSATHTCVGVAPAASCAVQITFTPAASGSRRASLRLFSNASGSPHSITVSGSGAPTTAPSVFALTVTRLGTGGGSVTSTSPVAPSINCGGTCNANFAPGTVVTLAATPSAGSSFVGWSGACAGTGTCSISMDNTRTAVATFDLNVPVPPSAPQALSAVSGDALAIFRFEPPATDGGSPIVSYSIACNPGTSGASRNGAPITVAGLTNGLEYSCWATATNSAGTGAASAPITVNPTAAAFALLLVQSRKDHGAAGTFDLEIDADQPLGGDVSVEPRVIGAGHQIVFQFNASISIPGSATAVDASATPIGTVSATTSANEVIVTLTDVLDNQRLRVSLSGVNGSTSVAASIAFLLGDVRESRTVTASDILPAKARAGQAANAANFAHDVDLSGAIAANDLLTIKAASGRSLP